LSNCRLEGLPDLTRPESKLVTDRYRDEDLVPILSFARGFDREVLISGLGYSKGANGATVLQHLWETEKGHCKGAALSSLAQRTEAASVPACVEALHSPSAQLQERGAMLLAQFGDASASTEMLAWLDRRLKRAGRARTWSPFEVPTAIRFGVRVGQHHEVAAIIARRWSGLETDERAWLRRTWPGLLDENGMPKTDHHDVAPPSTVQSGVYADEQGEVPQFGDEPVWGRDTVDEAMARARRRAARANGPQK